MSRPPDQSQPGENVKPPPGTEAPSHFERDFHGASQGHARSDSGYGSGNYPPYSQAQTHSSSGFQQGQGHQHYYSAHSSFQQPSSGHHYQTSAPWHESQLPNTSGGTYSSQGTPTAQAPSSASWPQNSTYAAHAGPTHNYAGHGFSTHQNPAQYWEQKAHRNRGKLDNARKEIEELRRNRSETATIHQATIDDFRKEADELRDEITRLRDENSRFRKEKDGANDLTRQLREAKRKAEAARRQAEDKLEEERKDCNKLRQEYTADLLAEGRWDKTIEVCQQLIGSLSEILNSLSADNVDAQTVHKLEVAIMETKTKLGDAYYHLGVSQESDLRLSEAELSFRKAESYFREAFGFWKSSLEDWYVDQKETREAQFWLCRALGAQHHDNAKLDEALKYHGRAQEKLHVSSSSEDDLNWAVKNLLKRPAILIRQSDFIGATDEIRFAWSASRKLDEAQLDLLAEETLDVADKIPNEHTSQRIAMLLCICTSNDSNRMEQAIKFRAQKALLDDYCLERRWPDAKIRLETLLSSPRVGSFLPVKELRARNVLVCRRLREWESAGTGAVELFEQYGYADGLSAAAEGVDFLDTLARAIEALAQSTDVTDLAMKRSNQRLAFDLLSRTHAQTEKMKNEGVVCQRPRLAKISNAGDVLLAERKKAARPNTPAERTYKDTKKKLDSFKKLIGVDGNVQRVVVVR